MKKNKRSSGEENIIKILKAEHINFVIEKNFSDLQNGRFYFDFYLPNYNICIEYDGRQHFEQVTHFQKTRSDFLKQQQNDRRKNSFCLAKGIKLYRIPFWEKDINKFSDIIQEKFLVKNKFHNDEIWRQYKQKE